jgi:hypothetical protein
MKKLLLLTLVFVMTISLVACGGTESGTSDTSQPDTSSTAEQSVTLVDVTTENNLTLKLPDTMTKQSDIFYADTTAGDSASFTVDMADESYPLSDMTQQDFIDFQFSGYDDLVIISYDNDLTINGNAALVCKFSFTSSEGNGIEGAVVFVTYKGAEYSVSLLYSRDDEDSALARNLQTCIDSISVEY